MIRGPGSLTAAGARRPASLAAWLAGLTALVLLGHALVIESMARLADGPPALKRLPDPVFTRLLQPATPPAVVPVTAPAPRRAPRQVVAAAANPAPEAVAQAPEDAASAARPQDVASPADPTPSPAQADAVTTPGGAASAPPASAEAPAAPDPWPTDTRLNYRLSGQFRGGPLYGEAFVQWVRQGNQYQAQVEIRLSPFGQRTLTSQGEVTPAGLVPRAYEESGTGRRRQVRLTDAEVVLQDGSRVPRPEGVQDTASQFVELGHRFRTGQEALLLGRSLEIPLARPGGVDQWTYDIVAQELLSTPRLGEIAAFRLKPRPLATPRGTLSAELWFAPSLQYLPARVRVTLGEDAFVDLMVESIEQR